MSGAEKEKEGDPEKPLGYHSEEGDPRIKRNLADVVRTCLFIKNWMLNRTGGGVVEKDTEAERAIVKRDISDTAKNDPANLSTGYSSAEGPKSKFPNIFKKIHHFTVDPAKGYYYYWSFVVSMACAYNMMIPIARATFTDLQTRLAYQWTIIDYACDAIYLLDLYIEAKKGYLDEGLMVSDPKARLLHYVRSYFFVVDIISILPTDIFYLILPGNPLIRLNRLLRCHRLNDFADRTETRTSFPNGFRVFKLIVTIFVLFHWNGCVYFALSKEFGYGPGDDFWVFRYEKILNPAVPHCDVLADELCLEKIEACGWNEDTAFDCYGISGDQNETSNLVEEGEYANASMFGSIQSNSSVSSAWPPYDKIIFSNLTRQYVFSFYWSALILTTIGEQVTPSSNAQFLFVIVDILIGLLTFATIVGNVGTMITNMNATETEFQERLDGVKQYMTYRKVKPELQQRVIEWFTYIRSQGQSLDEESVIENLPTKLKAEVAIQVHMDTLKRVRIFQDCEPGLLVELVLKLKLQVYSPGDYICRKGDVGKEMYIVKRGSLNVVAVDGVTVFVTLKEGSVFGELSILDIPGNKNGNKRTAGVRSVGYSDLFVLSKDDLWEAIKEYPDAKRILLGKGKEILEKDNLIDPQKAEDEELATGHTMEQRLENVEKQFERLGRNFDKFYEDFDRETAKMKQRLTALETTFRENKDQIKKDCLLGLL